MRVGAIIQARYESTRLPGKVLMPLPFPYGKPLLKHIVDAIRLSNKINYLCIATSSLPENEAIEVFANHEGISCFRGSEDDVLSRFISVTKNEKLDVVIRLTGDNPLLAIKQLEETLQYHIDSKNDYTKTSGLPVGMNFEIVKGNVLIELANKPCSAEDREHVTKYIIENEEYKKTTYTFSHPEIESLRCTIDYPSDYAMLNMIVSKLKFKDVISEMIEVLSENRWIASINSENHQVKFYKTIQEEVPVAKVVLKKYGLVNTIKLLKENE
jgi:spore coat polysaccharide biosynthesis protein SpsF